MSRSPRYLILADGLFGPETSKTANACIRYTPDHVVGVIDSRHAGKTSQQILGFGGKIPVVATLDDGLALGPNSLLIGIAPPGGQIPAEWVQLVVARSRTSSRSGVACTASSATFTSWQRLRASTACRSTTCGVRRR